MESIRVVQAFYRAPLTLTHQQKVTRLYRTALRTLDSWACDREIFLTRGAEIRERFSRNKKVDEGTALYLLREAEAEFQTWIHPDMWTNPYMPGGSKFMRNPPPPLRAIFPDGIPPEYNIASKDINGIQVPMSAKPEGMQTVLVDFMSKSAQ